MPIPSPRDLVARVRLTGTLVRAFAKARAHTADSSYTVADRLEARAARHPDLPAILYRDRRISYGELNARANRVAHWASGSGLSRGDAVALLMENRPEFLFCWLGLAKLGVVTALINTHVGGRGLEQALRTSGASTLILGEECAPRLADCSSELTSSLALWSHPDVDRADEAASAPLPGGKNFGAVLEQPADVNPDASVREGLRAGDDLFYIYTSGTTGLPKAARFSHMRFLLSGDVTAQLTGSRPGNVEYVVLPLYHTSGGVVAVSRVLGVGGTLALRRRFSASSFWDDVRKTDARIFQYVGELVRYLVAQPPRENDRDHPLEVAFGNGLRPEVWRQFESRFGVKRIIEFYGATEGNVGFTNVEGRVGSVGRFPFKRLSNARLVHLDPVGGTHPRDARGLCIECEPGEEGELLGRISEGTARFEGYTSSEDTDRKLLRDVLEPGDVYFRTGDVLRQDAQGFYYFVDRIGDTYRWKGENVSTQEVADALGAFPGIDMVTVYGVEVPGAEGRAGMAAFVSETPERFDPKAFYAFAARSLPDYAVPAFLRLLPEVPMTATFKLRKVDLQRQGFDLAAHDDALYVRDDGAGSYVTWTRDREAELTDGRWRL